MTELENAGFRKMPAGYVMETADHHFLVVPKGGEFEVSWNWIQGHVCWSKRCPTIEDVLRVVKAPADVKADSSQTF